MFSQRFVVISEDQFELEETIFEIFLFHFMDCESIMFNLFMYFSFRLLFNCYLMI